MAVLTIIQAPDKDLRQKAVKVERVDASIKTLLADMTETLASAGGLGLAAVQVGVPMRLFIVKNGTEYLKFIDPEIIRAEGRQESSEACLSIPGVFGAVKRPAHVTVRALDASGKSFELEASGRMASAIVHEYDHLDGVLFTDKAHVIRRFHMAAPKKIN